MGQNNSCSTWCHKKDKEFDLLKVIFSPDDKYRRKSRTLKKQTSDHDKKQALDQMQMLLSRPNSLKSTNSSSLRQSLKRLFSEDTEASEDVGTLVKDSIMKTKEYLSKFISDKWILHTDSNGVQIYTHQTDSDHQVFLKRSMIVDGTVGFLAAILQDLEDIEESSELVEKLKEKQDFCNGSRTVHRVDKPIGTIGKRDYYYWNTLKKLQSEEVYITNHSIKSDFNKLKDWNRSVGEGVTRIKPITKFRALITEIIKYDLKQTILENEYEKLVQIHYKEFWDLKNSLTGK